MKLDDTGVAYFVELVHNSEVNGCFIDDLSTSPILDAEEFGWISQSTQDLSVPERFISREAQTEIIRQAIKVETRNGKFKRKR